MKVSTPSTSSASLRPLAVTVSLLALALSGCVSVPEGAPAGEPVAIYITDLPANVTRLDVQVASVTVGGVPLQVDAPAFDLAALQGPEDAILLASGIVAAAGPVEVRFASAQATVDDAIVPVDVSGPLRLDAAALGGVLLDVSLPDSLQEIGGRLVFEPRLEAVYALDAAASAPDDLVWLPILDRDGDDASAAAGGVGASVRVGTPVANASAEAAISTAEGAIAEAEAALDTPPLEAATVASQTGWLVRFLGGTQNADMQAKAKASGAVFVFALESLPVAYVLATETQVARLGADEAVLGVEAEVPLEFHDAQSRTALRMPALAHPVTGLKDAAGNPIDGRGVGVAVVDTGIYAAHADMLYEPMFGIGPVGANFKVESLTYTDMVHTDSTSGHGTHVAAIVAGQGTNDPNLRGIAPGATIYGFGIGEASTTVWAAQAFDWILKNGAAQNPPIRVVTNSWGTGTSYDPSSVTNILAGKMADAGMVVVFSAGNKGGTGSTSTISAQCQIPKAGIICVAAYDDLSTGTRDGKVAPYSSRGAIGHSATWPDISAPGTKVMSARPPVGSTTGLGTNLGYVELSGTSQAAPHIAGVAALMLQKNPSLSSSSVEYNLKVSAYKFTDAGGYSGGSHYAKGAGLVDAYAAVSRV